MVLQGCRKGEMLHCGYILANGNWRSRDNTSSGSHTYEAGISCKFDDAIFLDFPMIDNRSFADVPVLWSQTNFAR